MTAMTATAIPTAPNGPSRAARLAARALAAGLLAWTLGHAASAGANCRRPAPQPVPFDKGTLRDACPFGYTTSGSVCAPSGLSARFVLVKPTPTAGCPSGYTSSGAFCVADGRACHAFAVSGGSCPSGYSSSRPWCVSD